MEEGYAKVATLMSQHPELAIFRSFREFNLQNLLYLQAEITHLLEELRIQVEEDVASGKMPDHAYDWWSLSQGENVGDAKQWEIILEIRAKMEIYYDALHKTSAMLDRSAPTEHDLQFFQDWLERPTMGSFPLYGLDRRSWDQEHEKDLVALRTRKSPSPFLRWFTDTMVPPCHHLIGVKFKKPVSPGVYEYQDSTLELIARIASTLVAMILPLCSIVLLRILRPDGLRLGTIVILLACYTLVLATMTNAQAIGIFTTVNGFAAIMVGNPNNVASALAPACTCS